MPQITVQTILQFLRRALALVARNKRLTLFTACALIYAYGKIFRSVRAIRRGLRGKKSRALSVTQRKRRQLPHARFSVRNQSSRDALSVGDAFPQVETLETEMKRRLEFYSRTKYVKCLGADSFFKLFAMTSKTVLRKGEHLFRKNEDVECGMFLVSAGKLGTYDEDPEQLMSVIPAFESLLEFELIRDAPEDEKTKTTRFSLNCVALTHTEVYFLSRLDFELFTVKYPGKLVSFTRTVIGRQWRVASYVMSDFLQLPVKSREEVQGSAQAAFVGKFPFANVHRDGSFSPTKPSSPAVNPRESTSPRTAPPSMISPSISANKFSVKNQSARKLSSGGSAKKSRGIHVESPQSIMDDFEQAVQNGHSGRCCGVKLVTLSDKEVLFLKGDQASRLYVVKSGALMAVQQGSGIVGDTKHAQSDDGRTRVIARMLPGMICGGISFLGGTVRGETIVADGDTVLYSVNSKAFSQLLTREPKRLLRLTRVIGRQLAPICKQFFEMGLDSAWYGKRDVVFRAGDSADGVYLVISGRISLLKEVPPKKAYEPGELDDPDDDVAGPSELLSQYDERPTLYEVGRGEVCGENSLLSDEENPKFHVTAACIRQTELVKISPASFKYVFRRYPEVTMRFSQSLYKRSVSHEARRNRSMRHENLSNCVLLPVGSPSTGIEASINLFASKLTQALSVFGPIATVTKQSLDALGPQADIASKVDITARAMIAHYLTELEEDNRMLLVQGDPLSCKDDEKMEQGGYDSSSSTWNHLICDQADLIVLVAYAGRDRPCEYEISLAEEELIWSSHLLDQHEAELLGSQFSPLGRVKLRPRVMMVLLHPQSDPAIAPINTNLWLQDRDVRDFHHIRMFVDADYRRLGRALTGNSVGLVLGGGGSRGLAHLGVLKALKESNVPVDYIGGTSQGSMIAAQYASTLDCGPSTEERARAFGQIVTWGMLLSDATFPVLSYFGGKGFTRKIREALRVEEGRDLLLEDLWLPYFNIVTNIRRCDMEIKRRGVLWFYVRASMGILGMVPPLIDDGDMLIDGGYCNNLPADEMAKHCKTVIAVDVENKDNSGNSDMDDLGDGVSGWWILFQRLVGTKRVPTFGEMLMWTNFINNARTLRSAVKEKLIDIYVRPDVDRFGLMDYLKQDEIMQQGYIEGRKVIDAWLAENEATVDGHAMFGGGQSTQPGTRVHAQSGEDHVSATAPTLPGGGDSRNVAMPALNAQRRFSGSERRKSVVGLWNHANHELREFHVPRSKSYSILKHLGNEETDNE